MLREAQYRPSKSGCLTLNKDLKRASALTVFVSKVWEEHSGVELEQSPLGERLSGESCYRQSIPFVFGKTNMLFGESDTIQPRILQIVDYYPLISLTQKFFK